MPDSVMTKALVKGSRGTGCRIVTEIDSHLTYTATAAITALLLGGVQIFEYKASAHAKR